MHFSSSEDNTRMEARAKSAHKEEKRKRRGTEIERRSSGDNRQESGGEQTRIRKNREK